MYNYKNIEEINKSIKNKCIYITCETTIFLYQYGHCKTMNIAIGNMNGFNSRFIEKTLPYLTNENKAFIETFMKEWMEFMENVIKSLKSTDLYFKTDYNLRRLFINGYAEYLISLNDFDKDNKFAKYYDYDSDRLIEIAYSYKKNLYSCAHIDKDKFNKNILNNIAYNISSLYDKAIKNYKLAEKNNTLSDFLYIRRYRIGYLYKNTDKDVLKVMC